MNVAENNTRIVIAAEDKASAAIQAIAGNLKGVAGAAEAAGLSMGILGATLSAGAFVAYIKNTVDAADALNDLSQKTGVGIKQLAAFKLSAEQSGTSLEAVAKGMKALSTYAAENGDTLKKLGIDTQDSGHAIQQLADIFAALPDGMQKSALATKLFGKAGVELIPMLNGGGKALAEAAEKTKVWGERMAELGPKADKFNDSMTELKIHSQEFGIKVANPIVHGLNKIITALEKEINASDGSIIHWLRTQGGGGDIKTGAEIRAALDAAGKPPPKPVKPTSASAAAEAMLGHSSTRTVISPLGSIRDAANQYSAELDAQIAKGAALTQSEKALADAKEKLTAAEFRQVEALLQGNVAKENQVRAEAEWIKFQEEAEKANLRRLSALEEQAQAAEDEVATYGLGKSAIEAMTIARLEEARAIVVAHGATDEQLSALDQEIATRKRLAEAMNRKEVLDADKKAAEEAQREWQKVADDVNRALTDAIMKGGKDGLQYLKDYAKTFAIRVAVEWITSPIAAALGGSLGGASGSAIGGASAASSLGSLGNLYSMVGGNSVGYGIGNLANLISGSTTGPAAPGSIGSLFSGAGSYANWQYGVAGLGGGLLGGAIGGSTGSTLGGLGASLGLALGGPLGGLIGSVGGGVLGSLFGHHGDDPHNNAQVSGLMFGINRSGLYGTTAPEFGGTGGAAPLSFVAGPTSGKGWWADSNALGASDISAFNAQVSAAFTAGEKAAAALGIDPAALAGVNVSSAGKANYNAGGKILGTYFTSATEALSDLSDAIAKSLIPNIDKLKQSGETAGTALARLASAALAAQQQALGGVAANDSLFASRVDQMRAAAFATNGQNFAIDLLGRSYAATAGSGAGGTAQVVVAINALRSDLRIVGAALAANTGRTATQLQRWDGDGMPDVRVL